MASVWTGRKALPQLLRAVEKPANLPASELRKAKAVYVDGLASGGGSDAPAMTPEQGIAGTSGTPMLVSPQTLQAVLDNTEMGIVDPINQQFTSVNANVQEISDKAIELETKTDALPSEKVASTFQDPRFPEEGPVEQTLKETIQFLVDKVWGLDERLSAVEPPVESH